VPRLTTTVGYDERFSGGHFGVWVVTDPDRATHAMGILKKHGRRRRCDVSASLHVSPAAAR
jgi:hypothetical protein